MLQRQPQSFLALSVAALVAASLPATAGAQAGLPVDTCGTIFTGDAHLTQDLDCPDIAVFVEGHGVLDMRGHTITTPTNALFCSGNKQRDCGVSSSVPGAVIVNSDSSGRTGSAVVAAGDSTGVARQVTISGFSTGVSTFSNRCEVAEAVIEDNERGIFCDGGVTMEDVIVRDNIIGGVRGDPIIVSGSTISGNIGHGIERFDRRLVMTDTDVSDNGGNGIFRPSQFFLTRIDISGSSIERNGGHGIDAGAARKARIRDTVIADNAGDGARLIGRSLSFREVSVSGNGGDGLDLRGANIRAKLKESTVSANAEHGMVVDGTLRVRTKVLGSALEGNATGLDCGATIPCADIAAKEQPKLRSESTCDTSYVTGSGLPGSSWGICALD